MGLCGLNREKGLCISFQRNSVTAPGVSAVTQVFKCLSSTLTIQFKRGESF